MNDAFELLDPFVRAGWALDCAVFMFDGVGLFFDNGALRVRIHPERVPFTVSDVFVNRGGACFVLCVCAQASEEDKNANKPVVAFKIDQDTLDRKELSLNVI